MAAVTKTEGGTAFLASDYAYVPDAQKPTTWKLRLTATPGGTPDAGHVGAAAAALGGGYRGNKASIPTAARDAVKAKVRAAWKKANPGRPETEMPDVLRGGGRTAAFPKAPPGSVAERLRALAQELAIGQRKFHASPGPVMSALDSAAAFLERGNADKGAARLDDAVKEAEKFEKAHPAAKGLADKVRALRDENAGTAAQPSTSPVPGTPPQVAAAPGNPQALRDWFNNGADGQINWGEHGAFDACVAIAEKHMDTEQAKGFCAERHNDATGKYPGAKAAAATVQPTEEVIMGRTRVTAPDGTEIVVEGGRLVPRAAAAEPRIAAVVGSPDLPLAPSDTPWDPAAAALRVAAWATTNGTVDWDKYGTAFLVRDEQATEPSPAAFVWGFGDVVNGQLMAIPAALQAAQSSLDAGDTGQISPQDVDAMRSIVEGYMAGSNAPATTGNGSNLESAQMLAAAGDMVPGSQPADGQPPAGQSNDPADAARLADLEARVSALEQWCSDQMGAQIAALMDDDSEGPLPDLVAQMAALDSADMPLPSP